MDDYSPKPLRAEDIERSILNQLAERVVEAASERRSTWARWNLYAEAARQTMGWRFAATEDREAVVGMITDAAEQRSTRLTPPELAVSPAEFRRADETSVFRPRNSARYSSIALLDAEERLLTASHATDAPVVSAATLERAEHARRNHGIVLGEDQRASLHSIATSARSLDVLIGPAGAELFPFVTDGTDIESHFLDLAYLVRKYPEINRDALEALRTDARAMVRDESVKVMINARNEEANRQRNRGEEVPSAAEVMLSAQVEHDGAPDRFTHGKKWKWLKRFNALVQEQHGVNRPADVVDACLAVTALRVPAPS